MAAAIDLAQFTEAIARAVDDRGRVYNHCFSLSIRWELDDTNASNDVGHFQAILSTLNFNKAREFVIPSQRIPRGTAWAVNGEIAAVFDEAAQASGHTLVIIQYVGHGKVEGGKLYAVEPGTGRSFNFESIIDNTVNPELFEVSASTDTVFILDCCYAYVATRSPIVTSRTVEILSATDESTPEAFAPPRNTLTEKLRNQIAWRKRDGHQFLELAQVMEAIRANSPIVKPTHHVKLGSSVRLTFGGVTPVNPRNIAPSLRAVFAVHVNEMTQEQLTTLIRWIETLPSSYSITLDGVYPTNSTLLIFQSAFSLFSNIAGYPGISLISEVSSPNLL